MNTPAPPHPANALAAGVAAILFSLTQLVFSRLNLFGDLGSPLHNRIARARRRLVNLLAALAAGRLPRPRAPSPGRKGGAPASRLPTRRRWLFQVLGHHAAAHSSQLQHLLHQPETLTLLAAAPPPALSSIARTLRPLCRLLDVELPPILQAPPKPPRPKPVRDSRARPNPVPRMTLRDCLPQRRPRDMPFLTPLRNFRRT